MSKHQKNFTIHHPSSHLFLDPHLNYPKGDSNFTFEEYSRACKELIRSIRPHASEEVIAANAPYELRPTTPILTQNNKIKHGALLLHGLLDSTFILKDIGHVLQAQGCLVRAVLLPGHGTVPGALLNVHYQDWIDTVRYGVASLAQDVEKIYLVGYSTGAALAILHALQYPNTIAGQILFSPAFKIRMPLAPFTGLFNSCSAYWEKAAWGGRAPEIDYVKYQSITMNSVYQVYQLTKLIKKQPNPLDCPTLTFVSADDKTICAKATVNFFQEQHPHLHKIILYKNNPATHPSSLVTERTSFYPKENILNFSHVGIPTALTNPHYGKLGDYNKNNNNCLYGSFTLPEIWLYDFLYKCRLIKKLRRILTFNPDFAYMIEQIEGFIK